MAHGFLQPIQDDVDDPSAELSLGLVGLGLDEGPSAGPKSNRKT